MHYIYTNYGQKSSIICIINVFNAMICMLVPHGRKLAKNKKRAPEGAGGKIGNQGFTYLQYTHTPEGL